MHTDTKENTVDWNNIFILHEFLTYFANCYLKDFSLVSRVVRNRLNSKLFFKIAISGRHIINNINLNTIKDIDGANVSDYIEYWGNLYRCKKLKDELGVQLSNNLGILVLKQLLKKELKEIEKLIKSFNIEEFSFSFYFLSPIITDLTSLTQLSLGKCVFPLLMMLRIGEHLKKLKIIKLDKVEIVGLIKQELSPEDVYLPQSLEELSIADFGIYNMRSVPNTLSLVQRHQSCIYSDLVNLRGFKIPSLKKLTLDIIYNSMFVLKLLKLNPQVEEFKIDIYNMTQDISNLISISSSIKKITIYTKDSFPYILQDDNLTIPNFVYIKDLNMQFENYCDTSINHNQCNTKYFPNLTHLALSMGRFKGFQLNTFLRINLPFNIIIDKLTLGLSDCDYWAESDYFESFEFIFDFSSLINIKCLNLDVATIPLYKLDFDNIPDKLRIIRIKFNPKINYKKYIEENPGIFKKWKVSLKGRYIYFTR